MQLKKRGPLRRKAWQLSVGRLKMLRGKLAHDHTACMSHPKPYRCHKLIHDPTPGSRHVPTHTVHDPWQLLDSCGLLGCLKEWIYLRLGSPASTPKAQDCPKFQRFSKHLSETPCSAPEYGYPNLAICHLLVESRLMSPSAEGLHDPSVPST